jgi:hypothetical protein
MDGEEDGMIPPTMVAWIEQLLRQGMSQREVHRRTGVSRGTIGRIARGQRPDHQALRQRKQTEELSLFVGPLQRCPGCGGLVEMPCRACHTRSLLARARRRMRPTPAPHRCKPLNLELRQPERSRYEVIHDLRVRHGQDYHFNSHAE